MCEVECNYKGKCISYPAKCGSCKHNTGKRDYFEPDYWPHWRRWYPYYPYWEYQEPYVWYGTTTTVSYSNDSNKDYYSSR